MCKSYAWCLRAPFNSTSSPRIKTLSLTHSPFLLGGASTCHWVLSVMAMGECFERSSHASRRALQMTSNTMPAHTPGRPQPRELTCEKKPRAAPAESTVRPPTQVIWLAPSTVPSSERAHGANGCKNTRPYVNSPHFSHPQTCIVS